MKELPKGAARLVHLTLDNRSGCHLITTINKWLSCSGPEWTVTRLKAYRTGAYQLRAGHPELAKSIWQSNGISYNHKTLIPKGTWGLVIARYLYSKQPAKIRRYDALLRIYTCIHLNTLTITQLSKAKGSINKPYAGDPAFLAKLGDMLHVYMIKYAHCRDNPYGSRLIKDGQKPKIDIGKLSSASATHDEEHYPCPEIREMPWGKHVQSLWTSVYLPEELQELNPAEKLRSLLEQSGANHEVAGHIAFLQEGGCKARVVAVPNVWIQLLMKPLDDFLDKIVKGIPESCSHEQNKGAYFMYDAVRDGKKLYCFDLSSATDRFPLELQQVVLSGLGLKPYGDAIAKIAKQPWRVKAKVGNDTLEESWSYQCGQPMGMYSSFKLFHLTHILLIKMLERKNHVRDSFRVLGDDVVITDPNVASDYEKVLHKIGMEISPTKSVLSHNIGEFAGFVAVKTNRGACVHRPFKYSGRHGFGAAIPMLYAYGSRVSLLSPWYSRKFEMFQRTLSFRNPDLSPLIAMDKDPEVRNLNSHLLGSMSNRFSYYLPYVPDSQLLDCYEEQQIILLGQKEIVNEDGFATAQDNAISATGRNLDFTSSAYDSSFGFQYSSDPLIKDQIRMEKERETSKENAIVKEVKAF